MFSFLLNVYRFIKILIKGLKEDTEFRALLIFITILLIGANVFYTQMEGWSIIDALYFSVMTMSTVGYGDLTPTTDISKLFTVIFTFLSIGAFVAFTAKFLNIIFEHNKRKAEKIKQKINNRKQKRQAT
ncbi:MAG: hypothetical protein CR968_02895 [Flavobacteriia bacterium]|nr:MAG: hypothetical protein CR968_02895 [Flavobacteriia bacterium]